jgi:very-short-patch-repair endonuclease
MSQGDIERRLLDADWVVVQPDVYTCAGTPLTHEAHAWAGVLALGAPVALGRRSAAWALRMDRAPVPVDEEPDFIVPESRRADALRAPARVRRILPSRFQVVHVRGLPVTPPQLTLRELGMVIPRDWLYDMVTHAIRRRIVTWSGLSTQLGRGWPGAAALREVLSAVAPGYQVVWEGVLHRALQAAGLPLEPQVEVALGNGRKAFLDLGNKRLRFGVEVDGVLSHLERFAADRQRDRGIHRVGWHVEHVAAQEVASDLDGVVREILIAAHQRADQLGLTFDELRAERWTA